MLLTFNQTLLDLLNSIIHKFTIDISHYQYTMRYGSLISFRKTIRGARTTHNTTTTTAIYYTNSRDNTRQKNKAKRIQMNHPSQIYSHTYLKVALF